MLGDSPNLLRSSHWVASVSVGFFIYGSRVPVVMSSSSLVLSTPAPSRHAVWLRVLDGDAIRRCIMDVLDGGQQT